jgi:hypothetical protein
VRYVIKICEPQRVQPPGCRVWHLRTSNLSRACLGDPLLNMNIELNLQLMLQLFTLSSFVSQRTVWRLALEALDLHKSPVGYMYRGGGRGGGRAWLFGRKSDFRSFPVTLPKRAKELFRRGA